MWTINGRPATDDEVAVEMAVAAAKGEPITGWSMPRNFPLWKVWRWPGFLRDYWTVASQVRYLNLLAAARKLGPKFKEEHDDDN